jgi:cytochrome c peroxidase
LSEFEENEKDFFPKDFIEEFIFRHIIQNQKRDLLKEMGILSANLKRLDKVSQTNEFTDSQFFDAMEVLES